MSFKINPSTKLEPKNNFNSINILLNSSSLQFLLSPIRSRRILIKIIWIIFLFSSLFLCVYYVVLNTLEYLNFDTTTSIYEIDEKQSEFPTISVCSTRGKSLEITMLSFYFNNEKLLNDWQNHLEFYDDTSYGKCFRFNSGKNMLNQSVPIKYSKISGVEPALYTRFYSHNTNLDFGELIVSISNKSMIPSTIFNRGHIISSGSYNSFIMKRIVDKKLEYPYNDCYNDIFKYTLNSTVIDFMKSKNWSYSYKECVKICRNLKYNETNNCGCYLNSLDEEALNECYYDANAVIKNCTSNFWNSFNKLDVCSDYCIRKCDTYTIEIREKEQTIAGYGNLTNIYTDFKTFENLTKNFFSIRVYYEDLKYTLITQHPKCELFDLISNIGGTMGLFLGFSFISFLEIFELIAELFFVFFF